MMEKPRNKSEIPVTIGKYLLQGYRMLEGLCSECGCVLLQDKKKHIFCPSCPQNSELKTITENSSLYTGGVAASNGIMPERIDDSANSSISSQTIELSSEVTQATMVLKKKLKWTYEKLDSSTNIAQIKEYVSMINEICNAILALRKL